MKAGQVISVIFAIAVVLTACKKSEVNRVIVDTNGFKYSMDLNSVETDWSITSNIVSFNEYYMTDNGKQAIVPMQIDCKKMIWRVNPEKSRIEPDGTKYRNTEANSAVIWSFILDGSTHAQEAKLICK